MKNIFYIVLILPIIMSSQDKINGTILEANEKNEVIGLPGANVYWLNTSVGAVTDIDGKFSIPYEKDYVQLLISYVGYKTDTITITEPKTVQHWLQPTDHLDAVTISSRKQATAKSYLQAANVFTVSSDECVKSSLL